MIGNSWPARRKDQWDPSISSCCLALQGSDDDIETATTCFRPLLHGHLYAPATWSWPRPQQEQVGWSGFIKARIAISLSVCVRVYVCACVHVSVCPSTPFVIFLSLFLSLSPRSLSVCLSVCLSLFLSFSPLFLYSFVLHWNYLYGYGPIMLF